MNRALGRYDRVEDSKHPGPELPRSKRLLAGKVEIVEAAVPDPSIIGREKLKRQRAAVNRLTDPLECERSYGRISEPAYLAGRAYLAVAERARGAQSKAVFEPGGGGGSHELSIGYAMEAAEALVAMQADVQSAVGAWAALILRGALVDGHSFREMAVRTNAKRSNLKRAKRNIAAQFRQALETLAAHWDKSGWPIPPS
ncbi:hypothetical protein [Methylocystis sp.]|uniref:hypothetical protein n=1 Tax=Methylocystis sp. TaxID=1911079 RepID=UPI003D14C7C4